MSYQAHNQLTTKAINIKMASAVVVNVSTVVENRVIKTVSENTTVET